jgi:hypothetical protein
MEFTLKNEIVLIENETFTLSVDDLNGHVIRVRSKDDGGLVAYSETKADFQQSMLEFKDDFFDRSSRGDFSTEDVT